MRILRMLMIVSVLMRLQRFVTHKNEVFVNLTLLIVRVLSMLIIMSALMRMVRMLIIMSALMKMVRMLIIMSALMRMLRMLIIMSALMRQLRQLEKPCV